MTMTRNGVQQAVLGQPEASNHANGVPEPAKRDDRHQRIVAAVAEHGVFGTAMATIRFKGPSAVGPLQSDGRTRETIPGKTLKVRSDIAIARIAQGLAVLVTKDGELDFPRE